MSSRIAKASCTPTTDRVRQFNELREAVAVELRLVLCCIHLNGESAIQMDSLAAADAEQIARRESLCAWLGYALASR